MNHSHTAILFNLQNHILETIKVNAHAMWSKHYPNRQTRGKTYTMIVPKTRRRTQMWKYNILIKRGIDGRMPHTQTDGQTYVMHFTSTLAAAAIINKNTTTGNSINKLELILDQSVQSHTRPEASCYMLHVHVPCTLYV